MYVICRGGCQIRPRLQLHTVRDMLSWQNLGCVAFGSLVLWISLESPSDLLYRLNCRVDKQPVVGDLFFAGLWIAGNSHRGEQITP